MRRRLLRLITAFVVLAAGGFLVAASGIIPIKASSGHWAITAWFFDFGKRRSVAMHTIGMEPPSLDDPDLIMKGAGHYEHGCRPCHGAPDLRVPKFVQAMTPAPPPLVDQIGRWKPEELFHIVKHGIKFTGMPAWPTQHRDDEVWAMVAFLLVLPQLDAGEYRQLVDGDAEQASHTPLSDLAAGERCARCHGRAGLGRGGGAFPKLAGQKREYLLRALEAYARGERHSGVMEPMVAGLSVDDMKRIAEHYSRPPEATPRSDPAGADTIEQGRKIATEGIGTQRVPACRHCHGPGSSKKNDAYPELAGQHADYLVLQLRLFKRQLRGGSSYAHLMKPVAMNLTDQQMHDVAHYYASLSSTRASDDLP